MSTIRLSGTTSGHYDLTVPAVAGTNSIDSSNLAVKDSSGNLGIGTASPNSYSGYTALTLDNATNGGIIDIERNGTLVGEMFTSDANTFTLAAVGSKAFTVTTNSITRMTINNNGYVTTPSQPRFLAVPAANANVSYSSQKHIYSATAYNVGGHYDTSNGRFTAPIGGFYWFEHRMAMSGGNQSTLEAKVYMNGSEFARSYLDYNGSTNTDRVQTIIQLSAGDYVEAYTHWASTNLNNYLSQGNGNTQNAITCFMGALVG